MFKPPQKTSSSKVSKSESKDSVQWLYLDLNSFFASCEQQDNPEYRKRPLAVVPMLTDTTCCIAASYEAKAFGVKTGVLVGEAKKMCPGLIFTTGHHKRYIEYHHKILEAVESCAPIEKICSVDEIAIQLSGSQQDLERAIDLSLKIKDVIQSRVGECLTSSIGLAPNRFLAKIAADMRKPNGITYITQNELPEKLFSLKLQDIPGVGTNMHRRLLEKGIRSVKELCLLDCEQAAHVWGGVWGDRMWSWLRGEDFELPVNSTKSMSHQHVLEPKLRNFYDALSVACRLLNKACVRLRKQSYYARRLSLSIKFQGPERRYFDDSVRFTETRDTFSLMFELRRMWQAVPQKLRPMRVSVVLSELVHESEHQFSFFEDHRREKVSLVMDELNERFGRDTVYVGTLHEVKGAGASRIAFQRVPELDEFAEGEV